MKYVIAILVFIGISFFFGAVLAVISINDLPMSDQERELEDRDQREYLRKWQEKRRKKNRS